ncbi:hypothetical protein L9F63_026925, partial [Diploptera punctata]
GTHLCLCPANNTVYDDVCIAQYYADSPVLPVEFFDRSLQGPTSWIKRQGFKLHRLPSVGQVSACFAKAFQRVPKSMITSVTSSDLGPATVSDKEHVEVYVFEVSMEIKEEDGRGGFSAVPKDRSYFKLRVNLEKQLCLTVQQVSENERELEVERCFGVLVSPGRNVKHSDMQLLEMVSMGSGTGDKQCYVISGHWDPADPAFEALNVETPRDGRIYITVAVDLVIRGIQEPVRFLIETPVKVFPQWRTVLVFQSKATYTTVLPQS